MCFIGLQQAYDSVHRELLWKVLTRFGIAAKMLASASSTNACGLACVQMAASSRNGSTSRGGCDKAAYCRHYRTTCSSLLRNIHVVLVRFREDEAIARDLVHLQEDVVVGRELPLACMRRAVWGML